MRGSVNNHEEDKMMMSPLFPRLHVSETERGGGPRAPPRNKMAVYEQLNMPSFSSSQRFNTQSSMVLPLPPSNCSTSLLPPSTYGGGGAERSLFMSFPDISGPSHLADNKPFIGFSSSSPMNSFTLPQIDKCSTNSFQPPQYCFPNFNTNFSWSNNNKLQDLHEIPNFRVLCSAPESNPALHCSTSGSIIKNTTMMTNSSSFFPQTQHRIDHPHALMSRHKELEEIVDLNARIQADRDIVRLSRALLDPIAIERSASTTSIRTFDSSPGPVKVEDRVSPSQQLCRGGKECDFVQESVGSRENNNIVAEEDRGVELLDGLSETSVGANSQSCSSVITPNHVRNVVGEKQFWKARKAIINQQRIFAVQVFELHRLIQVQKSIAGSAHLLRQQNSFTGETDTKPAKKSRTRSLAQKQVVDVSNPDQIGRDLSTAFPKMPRLDYEGMLGNSPSPPPTTTNNNMKPPPITTTTTTTKCLQAGNQWLVPVMSPSEGLVYKPYSGPMYPPSSSSSRFNMAPPIYGVEAGNSGNMFTTTTTNPPPLNHQQAYFPSFGSFPTPESSKENHSSSGAEAGGRDRDRDDDDALPLFPLEPMVQGRSDEKCRVPDQQQRTHVIKVVPHNPRSAGESAARIFRFIQEERKRKFS